MKHALTESEAVWIAAVIDCEGTLTVHTAWNKARHNHNLQFFGRVEMVGAEVPSRLQTLCGGSRWRSRSRQPNGRPRTVWNITSNGLRWLLPQLLPYLIVKHRHAEILLELLAGNPQGRHGCAYKTSFNRLQELMAELRTLNYIQGISA